MNSQTKFTFERTKLKISIVIPVINEVEQIELAIQRAWKAGADEVIIADGGSTDGTLEKLAELNCKFVSSALGRAAQMNSAAKCATGEILLFLHADNWLSEECGNQLRELFNSQSESFGGFQQRIRNDRKIFRWIESGNGLRLKWQGLIYGDQAMFIAKQLFDSLGGFPEIDLMEDFSFSKSLRRFGKPVLLEGPTFVSARRWEKVGPVRQTVMNWFFAIAYRLGASPKWISRLYGRHDK